MLDAIDVLLVDLQDVGTRVYTFIWTVVSEGRGTTVPFQVVGAPGIDPFQLAKQLERYPLPGIRSRPARFLPTFDKFQGETCGGVWLHVTDRRQLRDFRATLRLMATIRRHWPESFGWLPPPYEYEETLPPIDIPFGDARLRERLDAASELGEDELDELVRLDEALWRETIQEALLYRGT